MLSTLGRLELDPAAIFTNYIGTHALTIDLVSSLPLDWLLGALVSWRWFSLGRLLRLGRLLHLSEYRAAVGLLLDRVAARLGMVRKWKCGHTKRANC